MHARFCLHAAWRVASLIQPMGQGHRKAARMRRCKQFFWIGAFSFFKARNKCVGSLERSKSDASLSFAQIAVPDGLCFTYRHRTDRFW